MALKVPSRQRKNTTTIINNYHSRRSCSWESSGGDSLEIALNGSVVGTEPQLNFVDTDTVNFTVTDNAGVSVDVEADVQTQMSITSDASGLKLSWDVASPGNSYYYGTNSSGVKWFFTLPAAGTWDVVGPASSTDNAVSRFDGTTGKIIQNSGVIIDDTNNVTGIVDMTMTGDLNINDSTSPRINMQTSATNRFILGVATWNNQFVTWSVANDVVLRADTAAAKLHFTVQSAAPMFSITSNAMGLLTTAPTHTLTMGSTGTWIALHNVTDQTTNYERGLIRWNSNNFDIEVGRGTTVASPRSMRLRVEWTAGNFTTFAIARAAAPYYDFTTATTTLTSNFAQMWFTTNNSSGTSVVLSLWPTLSQTGTAGYSVLLINPTESTTWSGVKALIQAKVWGAARFFVSNTLTTLIGVGTEVPTHPLTFASGANAGIAIYNTSDQTTNYERWLVYWNSNRFTLEVNKWGWGWNRVLRLTAQTNHFDITNTSQVSTFGGCYVFNPANMGNVDSAVIASSPTSSASSVNTSIVRFRPNFTHTGTASYNILDFDVTETTTGSGEKNFAKWAIGGVKRFLFDNNGNHYMSGSVIDANSNELLKRTSVASAVNEFSISNEATWGKPVLSVTWDDTNITMAFQVKGSATYDFRWTSATAAIIRLYEDTDNGQNYIGLKSPASNGTNIDYTLPATAPTSNNQFLISSTAGVMSWTTEVLSDFVTLTGTQTLTNKTINLSNNTLSGTTAQFNAALSDNDFATLAWTETLTNKRIVPRVTSITSSATPTINTDNCDAVTITALATAITSMTTNLTGTPNNFDKLIFRIKDDGTARAITRWSSFEAKGVALPTTTVISKVLTVLFIYDSVTSKRWCVASAQEA